MFDGIDTSSVESEKGAIISSLIVKIRIMKMKRIIITHSHYSSLLLITVLVIVSPRTEGQTVKGLLVDAIRVPG